jgi:protein-L-isoaspartate(D-aspartate) O-methyltransferase
MAVSAGAPENSTIAEVFASIHREDYAGPPPWRIFGEREDGGQVVNDPALLYQDVLVQLKAEAAINNGQPSLHALCFAALKPAKGETVIHIGTGTGYYTAMLAQLVSNQGWVLGYEIEYDLAARAVDNLAAMPWVQMHTASGTEGPLPQCDVLYVSAGATSPLPVWLDALKMGGRLLFPLTPNEGGGAMLLVTRWPEGYAAKFLCGARFVGCLGARYTEDERRIAESFRRGNAATVRSLVRSNSADATAWCACNGWWLSTRQIPTD